MPKQSMRRLKLGDLLVQQGLLDQGDLEVALAEQKRSGQKFGRVLTDLGLISEESLHQCLANHLNVEWVDLNRFALDADAARRLPEPVARRFRALPLRADGGTFLVGMTDPTDIFAIDEIQRHMGGTITPVLVSERDVMQMLDQVYRAPDEIDDLAKALKEELATEDGIDIEALADDSASDAPVIRLIQTIFKDAVAIGASDIHLEPDAEGLRVRQRVDGLLQERHIDGPGVASAVVTRIKLMAGLDISERRLPQDGRFSLKVDRHQVDVRGSTLPVQYGESMVMRLLDHTNQLMNLEDLGISADLRERLTNILERTAGMMLVTGPTGSGKTTTLYASLNYLNSPARKILTAEDPVEYRLAGISQVQVNAKIGLDFSRVLRTALRQDPDVILVGEMRDRETVEIGLRAAMTGHLVLSTLHTVNAAATVSRLLDMGGEGFLVAASLQGVIAQRLVRRLCDHCKAPARPEPGTLAWLAASAPEVDWSTTELVGAVGCPRCHGLGYKGRVGIYELLEIDGPLADAIRAEDLQGFEELARAKEDYVPLTKSALDLALQGVTSVEEVMRVAAGVTEHAESTLDQPQPISESEVDRTLAAS